jgi:hypothetical protein
MNGVGSTGRAWALATDWGFAYRLGRFRFPGSNATATAVSERIARRSVNTFAIRPRARLRDTQLTLLHKVRNHVARP